MTIPMICRSHMTNSKQSEANIKQVAAHVGRASKPQGTRWWLHLVAISPNNAFHRSGVFEPKQAWLEEPAVITAAHEQSVPGSVNSV